MGACGGQIWLSRRAIGIISSVCREHLVFEGGIQADFVFHSSDVLQQVPQMLQSGNVPDIILRGTRVLVDKENVLAQLPPPSRLPSRQPPDAETFRQALDHFWFGAVYCAKQLRRSELWAFQNGSGGMLGRLLQMVEWHTRVAYGWDTDIWHGGKFIAEWAGTDVHDDLCWVFAHYDVLNGWQAMEARLNLFHRLAREVAARLGFDYPARLETQIVACVDKLHQENQFFRPKVSDQKSKR
jgi:aminoglycoside 6-adenylyltransferase